MSTINSATLLAASSVLVEKDERIKKLRDTHEFYNIYAPHWAFYVDAYEGGRDIISQGNIFKHVRENEEDYIDRVRRANYLNYCAPVVDFYTNFIFSDVIERDSDDENNDFYQNFLEDVNKRNESIMEFMCNVCTDIQVFGISYVLVDSPEINLADSETTLTVADVENNKLRPYWILIKPDEILDWATDDFGKYNYLKRRQFNIIRSEDGTRKTEKYTEFYPDRTLVSVLDVTDPKEILITEYKTEFKNNLGEIPIVVSTYKKSMKYKDMGDSFLMNIAYNNRQILNLTSMLDEFLYRQCFNILTKQRESAFPLISQDEGDFGPSNVFEYPKGAERPGYISPPVDPAKFLQEERQQLVNEIYRQAIQDLRSDLANGSKSSGFSQAQSFSKTVPFIAKLAQTLEIVENKLMYFTMKYIKQDWKGKISYKDHYDVTNITDYLLQLTGVFRELIMPSETFAKVQLKRVVKTMDMKLSPEQLIEINKEIDDMDFEEWQLQMSTGVIASPVGNPASDLTRTLRESKPATPPNSNSNSKESKSQTTNTGQSSNIVRTAKAAAKFPTMQKVQNSNKPRMR